jgi:Zn-dependent protease with chaperone function
MSRRSQALLFALGFVAAANGLLLGISLYALFAAVLHVLSDHAPGIGWGLVVGVVGAIALLVRAFRRAAATRDELYGRALLDREVQDHARLLYRLGVLRAKSRLTKTPSLRVVRGDLPNAYTVSRSQDEAAIVLTDGLLRRLPAAEQEAVIAHELAQIENEDIGTVGLADAIAVSIEELGRLKGKFFWGPREILADILPFLGAFALLVILDYLTPRGTGNGFIILLLFALVIWVFYMLWKTALLSWRGLGQLAMMIFFFGPLTLVEWVLAPPTAFALSRLVSRERVAEADRRAVELTGKPGAALAALRSLEGVEHATGEPFWAALRFSLFVAPRADDGWRGWSERVVSTHPPVSTRIERLREQAQEDSRDDAIPNTPVDPLEQSG